MLMNTYDKSALSEEIFRYNSHNFEKKCITSNYFGVFHNEKRKPWVARRWSKTEKNKFYNGYYSDEKIAAQASDTLARNLMANGEQNLNLNFPNGRTEVYRDKVTEVQTHTSLSLAIRVAFISRIKVLS